MGLAAYALVSIITASGSGGDDKSTPGVTQLTIPMASKQACKSAQQEMIPSPTFTSETERTSVKKNPDVQSYAGTIRHQTFCFPTGE